MPMHTLISHCWFEHTGKSTLPVYQLGTLRHFKWQWRNDDDDDNCDQTSIMIPNDLLQQCQISEMISYLETSNINTLRVTMKQIISSSGKQRMFHQQPHLRCNPRSILNTTRMESGLCRSSGFHNLWLPAAREYVYIHSVYTFSTFTFV